MQERNHDRLERAKNAAEAAKKRRTEAEERLNEMMALRIRLETEFAERKAASEARIADAKKSYEDLENLAEGTPNLAFIRLKDLGKNVARDLREKWQREEAFAEGQQSAWDAMRAELMAAESLQRAVLEQARAVEGARMREYAEMLNRH